MGQVLEGYGRGMGGVWEGYWTDMGWIWDGYWTCMGQVMDRTGSSTKKTAENEPKNLIY